MRAYIIILCFLGLLDAIWLGIFAKEFYANQLGYIMTESFNLWAAGAFYPLYAFGIYWFVIRGSRAQTSCMTWVNGALFGLIAYGTYDLTNYATLKGWPWQVVTIDMLWGSVLTGSVAWMTYQVLKRS